MRNVKKYITFAIFLSFAFISNIFATEVVSVQLNKDSVAKIDFSKYAGVSCTLGETSKTRLVQVGSDYQVEWIPGVEQTTGTDYYSCSYESIVGIPYHNQPEEKKIVLNVHYGKQKSIISITLVKDRYESRNLLNDTVAGGVNRLNGLAEVTYAAVSNDDPSDRYDTGNPHVSLNCPTGQNTNCSIELKSSLPRDDKTRWALVHIKYKMTDGSEAEAIIDVQIFSSSYAFAYPGSFGTCNFDSSWENDTSNPSARKKKVTGNTINLPNCTVENSANPLIDFKGWVNFSSFEDDSIDYKRTDVCANYINASVGSNPYIPENNVFFACYTSSAGIILMPNDGEIPMASNYIKVDDVIYVKQEGMITLPEPTSIPSLYNMYGSGRFEGWIDVNGVTHAAGTTVPADGGRYMARYSTGLTVSGDEVNQKMVYVYETSPYKLNSTIIESCVSTDESKVVANVSGGECMLTGVSATDSEYVDVLVTTPGSSRTLKVRVVSRESDLFGEDWNTVVIEEDTNITPETQDGYFENIAGANVCNTYAVSNNGQIVNDAATYNGFGLDVSKYKAKSKCNDGKEYLALCMDPGRPGPNSADIYEIDKSFTTTNEFGQLVSHIVQKFVNESESDTNIAAANIALRIIEYYSTEELANSSNGGNDYLRNSLAAYKAVGEKLKDTCPSISDCSENQVYNALGKWNWNNDAIRRQTAKYLAGFSGTATSDDNDIKNKTSRKSSFDPNNDFLYHIEYKGTLTFPTGMTVSEGDITTSCGSVPGVTNCNVIGEFTSGSVYEYTFTYDIDLSNTGFYIPKTTSDESPSIQVTSTSGVTSANVFVIKTINDNKQRMVIFNTEPVQLKVIMPIYVVCDINKEPFIIGGPGFRDDLFKAAGCCEFITDETSNEFLTYCTADCIRSNFATVCNPNYTVGDNGESDVYTINESYKANASGAKELNYSCIVDVADSSTAIDNTNSYADDVGNYYALMAYKNNQYCTVSCKEDWDLSTSSFANFVGVNAIAAGQYFAIDNDMFIGGARTCVTTFIDYEQYKTDMRALSKQLTNAWSTQSEYSKVYSVLDASKSKQDYTYNTYKVTDEYDCNCDTDPETGESINCDTCYTWAVDKTETCTVYSISTSAGGQYQNANWSDYNGYATEGVGNISTNQLGGAAGGGSEIHTDWYQGNMPDSSQSSCSSCQGYCKQHQNYEYLLDNATYKGANVKSTIDNNRSTITSSQADIRQKALDMTDCQNFELKNTSTQKKNAFNYDGTASNASTYKGNSTISGFIGSSKTSTVETKFEPAGEYEYEEEAFMKLLGRDNVIEPHMELNADKLEDAGHDISTFTDECITLDRKNSQGEYVKLCKNKLTTKVYNPGTAWVIGSQDAKTYGGDGGNTLDGTAVSKFKITICDFKGSGYEYDTHGNCDWAKGEVSYYEVNYIKQTLENSSYFRNKGYWWQNKATDSKLHADTISEATSRFKVDQEHVTLYGAKDNTFPIGITTPRNIYQYTYTFSDIGYFSDGTTGRIMGNPATSLVAVNKHACFYEVYEDICRCCGDPILWTTYESSKYDDTNDFLNENGYNYNMSNTSYDPSKPLSSHLGYLNSSISLYDVAGSDGALAGNWSSTDLFTYQSAVYETGKGEILANEIMEKGETVYDTASNKPEYSYTLNANAIALIKEYNSGHSYGYSTSDLIAYGVSNKKTAINANISVINSNDLNDVNTFSHYGSKFLEEYMTSYVTEDFKQDVLTRRTTQGSATVCSVEAGPDAARQAFSMIQNNNCRWVDYIETTNDGNKVRLAFK
ncbi:MAG: hypothetical protein ACI4OP_00890 [Candidatus Coprovivens sp.]